MKRDSFTACYSRTYSDKEDASDRINQNQNHRPRQNQYQDRITD